MKEGKKNVGYSLVKLLNDEVRFLEEYFVVKWVERISLLKWQKRDKILLITCRFCPSVFLYLSSVVPAIWLLELDKVERRHKIVQETFNFASAAADLKELDKLLGVNIRLPDIQVDAETWVTLIEQFLMLVLIIGRWLLPKGDLTRDQLSQLLLVYIGNDSLF